MSSVLTGVGTAGGGIFWSPSRAETSTILGSVQARMCADSPNELVVDGSVAACEAGNSKTACYLP